MTEPLCSDRNLSSTVVSVIGRNIDEDYHGAKFDLRVEPIEVSSENTADRMVQDKKYLCQAKIKIVYDPLRPVYSVQEKSDAYQPSSLELLRRDNSGQEAIVNLSILNGKSGVLIIAIEF